MRTNILTLNSGLKLSKNIELNSPLVPNQKQVFKYLEHVHQNRWFTNFGVLHNELTDRLEEYLGVKNLLLVNNGTTAIQVAAKTLGTRYALTTPYSFAATSSGLEWIGVKLGFCDIDANSLNLDAGNIDEYLIAHNEVDTLVTTHIYGNPTGIEETLAVAEKHKKRVIFDGAQSFGVKYKGKSALSYGDATALSFHATKIFHTVEGGAVYFKSESDKDLAKQMINFGFDNSELGPCGINGKLNEYQAAVGLTLLDVIDDVIEHRVSLYTRYQTLLQDSFTLQLWDSSSEPNGGYFPVLFDCSEKCKLAEQALAENGVQTRVYFQAPLHDRYGNHEHCPLASQATQNVLTLPLHAHMQLDDVDYICEILKKHD